MSYVEQMSHTKVSEDYAWGAAGVPAMEGHASWVHAYYPPGTPADDIPLYAWLMRFRRAPGAVASIEEASTADRPSSGAGAHRGRFAHGGRNGHNAGSAKE